MALYPPEENGCHTCVFLETDPPCRLLGRQVRAIFEEAWRMEDFDDYEEITVVLELDDEAFVGALGASWRLARSLVQLREEVNAKAPKRSKAADGSIGDAAHRARASRHNPNNAGVVCAVDITHDPRGGMSAKWLFQALRTRPHPDLEYVVHDRQIASRGRGFTARPYGGSNPHTGHIHIGVGRGPDKEPTPPYDDTTPWLATAPDQGVPVYSRTLIARKPYPRGEDVLWVQKLMNRLQCYPQGKPRHLTEDGIYGPDTAHCVEVFQYRTKIQNDGIVGRVTWEAMRRG